MGRLKVFFGYFKDNKRAFLSYSSLSFLVGFLELFGVALTYPFILKLLSEDRTASWQNSPVLIGCVIILLFLAKNLVMIKYAALQSKFTKAVEAEVNLKFVNYFLASEYSKTSKISLAQKENILGYLIPNVINNYVLRILNLNVNFFIFTLISLFLLIKFPLATVFTTMFALILVTVQYKIFKPKLKSVSDKLSQASSKLRQRCNEVILNIKGVKISNNEKFFFNNYKNAIENLFENEQQMLFYNIIPPYITEPFIIVLLFTLLIIIAMQNFSQPDKLVASFALIVSAIFRLSPTISRIQVNLNGINSALPLVDEFLDYCNKFDIRNVKPITEHEFQKFEHTIELKNINFSYEDDKLALKNINLSIKKGEFIGIAGLSGAGKTTLADIIAGLLKPKSGIILVDGIPQTNPLKIGYIPQEFNLINGSIKENVTFGAELQDDNKVIEALKNAKLYDFIKENYPEGIYANPFVDSTGFSQGQKQRLAIARALYSEPDILIMDEATSSLDLKTEDELCIVLNSLKGNMTIIAIAHRLSTIKNADKIVFIKNAEIIDIAAFDNLIKQSSDFKTLVELGTLDNSADK